jgi:hypothetical protein
MARHICMQSAISRYMECLNISRKSFIYVIRIIIIQFNSVRVYLRTDLTAQRPITKLAQAYRSTQK